MVPHIPTFDKVRVYYRRQADGTDVLFHEESRPSDENDEAKFMERFNGIPVAGRWPFHALGRDFFVLAARLVKDGSAFEIVVAEFTIDRSTQYLSDVSVGITVEISGYPGEWVEVIKNHNGRFTTVKNVAGTMSALGIMEEVRNDYMVEVKRVHLTWDL